MAPKFPCFRPVSKAEWTWTSLALFLFTPCSCCQTSSTSSANPGAHTTAMPQYGSRNTAQHHPEETAPCYAILKSTNKVTDLVYYARWYKAIAQCPWQVHRVSRTLNAYDSLRDDPRAHVDCAGHHTISCAHEREQSARCLGG